MTRISKLRNALAALETFDESILALDFDLSGVDAHELLDQVKEKVGEEGSLFDALFDVLSGHLNGALAEEEGKRKPKQFIGNPRYRR